MSREHICLKNRPSIEPSWWTFDARGIALCRVCSRCKREKLARYRPEILSDYDRPDVDEPIDSEEE